MVGTFEKPLYVTLDPSLCAHSRAGQIGCTRCLDSCPTGAITPAGDKISVDPMVCAGCGACSARCPSGAISYDAPPVNFIFRRIHTLSEAYHKAGGNTPRLLVCDEDHRGEMIALAARLGRGIPADVIPLELSTLPGFGHAEMLAALGSGFASVDILLSPHSERETLEHEYTLANTLAGETRIRLLDITDPDALCEILFAEAPEPIELKSILPLGSRRQITRLATGALRGNEAVIELPQGAPYGTVIVNTTACTLCLACASLCPSGALSDNPDNPELRFQEDACLQCGLCATVCPENAISLKPQIDLSAQALHQRILHQEEPYACIECGILFGVKSTVEKVLEKLAGKHSMFAESDTTRLIQMCDNCRVMAQFHSTNHPFASNERPRVRTTDDYLALVFPRESGRFS